MNLNVNEFLNFDFGTPINMQTVNVSYLGGSWGFRIKNVKRMDNGQSVNERLEWWNCPYNYRILLNDAAEDNIHWIMENSYWDGKNKRLIFVYDPPLKTIFEKDYVLGSIETSRPKVWKKTIDSKHKGITQKKIEFLLIQFLEIDAIVDIVMSFEVIFECRGCGELSMTHGYCKDCFNNTLVGTTSNYAGYGGVIAQLNQIYVTRHGYQWLENMRFERESVWSYMYDLLTYLLNICQKFSVPCYKNINTMQPNIISTLPLKNRDNKNWWKENYHEDCFLEKGYDQFQGQVIKRKRLVRRRNVLPIDRSIEPANKRRRL